MIKWFQAFAGAVLLLASHAGIAAPPSTAVAREQAWSTWQVAVDDAWRRWRVGEITSFSVPGFEHDMDRVPKALVAAGVLPGDDDHAWTVGCSDFSSALTDASQKIVSPMGLEQWLEWRAVYRVTCGPLAAEKRHLQLALGRIPAPLLPPSPTLPWEVVLLDEIESSVWECMEDHVPTALRQGLDRHEGLKLVARQCGVDPAMVFGSAQRCNGCVVHPRQPRQLLFRTWAQLQSPGWSASAGVDGS